MLQTVPKPLLNQYYLSLLAFCAFANILWSEALCFWAVCPVSVRASGALLTQYLEKCWTGFVQFGKKDERFKFGVSRSKFEITLGPTCWKVHFLSLLTRYFEIYWS